MEQCRVLDDGDCTVEVMKRWRWTAIEEGTTKSNWQL